jgi:1-aminocyclopropane-1-carboxylate deaminase/D-cysteine desulfhydrase-like pyridoxal-dependent ACC family enzyme
MIKTFTPTNLTPLEQVDGVWVKRDDLYRSPAGLAPGGKARTCYALALQAKKDGHEGLVTAGSRFSPQVNIVAQIGAALRMPVRVHTPQGEAGPEVLAAIEAGAERIAHRAGYNSVIVKRAEQDAEALGWGLIPFGMECEEAVIQTSRQVDSLLTIPNDFKRIVVPVGSGMSLCGVLRGLGRVGLLKQVPVLGVTVGADPSARLEKFAPLWRFNHWLELRPATTNYHTKIDAHLGPVKLDPVYEAKCLEFLEPGDLFWIVGIRQTAV